MPSCMELQSLNDREREHKRCFLHSPGVGVPPGMLLRDLALLNSLAYQLPAETSSGRPSRLTVIPGSARLPETLDVYVQYHERYFPIHLHTHDWLELLCVVSGQCPHRVGSNIGELSAGDVLIISPGTQHSFLAMADDCLIYNIYLPLQDFEQVFQPVLQGGGLLSTFLLKTLYTDSRDSYLIFHTGDYFRQDNRLAELVTLTQQRPPHLRQRLNAAMQLFLLDLLDRQAAPPTVSIDQPGTGSRDKMMVEYVRSHSRSVSVQELSQVFSYSERQITRIFQQATGGTCIEFIQHCRMEQFLSLLLGTNMSVQQALERAGIRSANSFYRSFRSQFGMSPLEYRMAYRKTEA